MCFTITYFLKNASIIEIKEVLNFRRHLSTNDIETIIISWVMAVIFFLK